MNLKKSLIIGAFIGLIVGVLFIYVQPYFGMTTLTSRHAGAYVKLSDITPSIASIIAWSAHLFVSVGYGVVTAIALFISKNLIVFGLQTLVLGWFTTVIAGPANELIIRLVTSNHFPSFTGLPALNFNFDAKLALHVVFFAVISLFILLYKRLSKSI
jgi:hypothetical protein